MIEQNQLEGTLPIYLNEEVIGSIDWKISKSQAIVYLKLISGMAKDSYIEAMENLFGENGFIAQAELSPELAPAMIINITEWTNLEEMTKFDHGNLAILEHLPKIVSVVDTNDHNNFRSWIVYAYISFVSILAMVKNNISLSLEPNDEMAKKRIVFERDRRSKSE